MRKLLTVCACWITLGGCSVEILHDLDEGQANQILDAFNHEGIRGKKVRVSQGTKAAYTVTIGRADAPSAWRVLRRLDLPRKKQKGVVELFGKVGLVPTATQERALMRQALAGEISRTLQAVEGVRYARVHVVIPRRDLLAPWDAKKARPRASVLLKVGRASPLSEAEVKRLVAGAVDGLAVGAVQVVITKSSKTIAAGRVRAEVVTVGPFKVAAGSRGALVATLIVCVLLIGGLAFFGFWALRRARRYPRGGGGPAEADGGSLGLDSSLSLAARSLSRRASTRAHHTERSRMS